jgi:hypothetical protein
LVTRGWRVVAEGMQIFIEIEKISSRDLLYNMVTTSWWNGSFKW